MQRGNSDPQREFVLGEVEEECGSWLRGCQGKGRKGRRGEEKESGHLWVEGYYRLTGLFMLFGCYSLPFLLLPAPQASDSSLSRDLPSTSQPQPGLSGLPLSFLFTDCVTTRGCCSIPRPHLTPPEHKPREGRCDECFIQHSLLTLSPLPGTWGMFNEYSPNE